MCESRLCEAPISGSTVSTGHPSAAVALPHRRLLDEVQHSNSSAAVSPCHRTLCALAPAAPRAVEDIAMRPTHNQKAAIADQLRHGKHCQKVKIRRRTRAPAGGSIRDVALHHDDVNGVDTFRVPCLWACRSSGGRPVSPSPGAPPTSGPPRYFAIYAAAS